MVELINLFLFKIYNFQNSKCFKSLVTGFEVDVCVVKYSTHAFSYIFLVCFSNNTFNEALMELIFLFLLKLCNFEMLNYLKATVIGFDSEQQN